MSDIHFTENGCMFLECFADDPDADSGQIIDPVDAGDSWDTFVAKVREHQAEHGCAPEPQPAPELAALADELDRLAGEHSQKAAEYDRDAAQENFHRGCSAALANTAGRIRYLIASQQPQPAPELAAMAETRKVRKVVREFIGMFHGIPGGYGARTSFRRLSRLAGEAGVEPPQPGQPLSAALADELGVLQDHIGTLAAGLKLSASSSHPSKKSEIETGVADALLALLDPR